MFRPKAARALAFERPNEAACAVIARYVEQIARRPSELDGEASPLIEEPASFIDGLPPIRIRNPHRLLDLQPRPSIEIRFRHAVHCHAFAFFELCFLGFGRGRYVANYASNFAIWNLIVFYT